MAWIGGTILLLQFGVTLLALTGRGGDLLKAMRWSGEFLCDASASLELGCTAIAKEWKARREAASTGVVACAANQKS